MHLASQALAWVRAMLFGLPAPEVHHQPPPPCEGPALWPGPPPRSPSPEMWAAFLASARRRRGSQPQPRAELPAITPDDISSTLVGAYLLTPEVRQHLRYARRLAEVS